MQNQEGAAGLDYEKLIQKRDQLLANGFPAVSIAKENRLEYFTTLEAYAAEGDLSPFAEMIAGLVDQQLDRYLAMDQPVRRMEHRQDM